MYAKLVKFIYKIENNNILSSIKRGFVLLIPVLLIGSFALLFRSFPVSGFQNFLAGWAGGLLLKVLNCLFDSTVGFLSAYLVLSISFYYSEKQKVQNRFLQIMAMITALVCFVALFGAASGSMELADLGPVGVFTAMFAAIAATKLFYLFYSWLAGPLRFRAPGADMDYRNSICAILPLLFCALTAIGLNQVIQMVFQVANLNDLITDGIINLFDHLDGGLGVGLLYVFILNVLWMLGIHGGNALEQVAQTYLVPADAAPDIVISKSFLDNFALIGGCGTTICLLLALLLFARSRDSKHLARTAAPAVLFNINEILVYGLPIVLNPIMLLPFILTPLCSFLIAYGATMIGFLPVTTEMVSWTTPVFFSGYLASGSYHGVVVQLIVVLVGTAIYMPFVRISERIRQNQAKLLLTELTDVFRQDQKKGKPSRFLERNDSMGLLAKNMVAQLRLDVEVGVIPLGYQPQFHYEKGMVGAEALLRWQYSGQNVYPPLVVALAQEDGFYDRLTQCVLQISMRDCSILLDQGYELHVSVNVTAKQLNDPRFAALVIRLVQSNGVGGHFCLEVTEETSTDQLEDIAENIRRLRKNGVMAAVDDFSMGHTSLKYLQNNSFQMVKLDGGLVRHVTDNPRSREIVASIVSLGRNLDFQVLAEYVETVEIRDALRALGCEIYQGYLYSPAIPFAKWKEMIQLDGFPKP